MEAEGQVNTELWCLVGITLWTVVLNYLPLLGRMGGVAVSDGLKFGFGNRDSPIEGAAWVQRADRAHRNHLENLPLFIVLILVGKVSGHQDHTTATAAMVFVGARLAHTLCYVAGLTFVRTLVFWTSLGALGWLLYKLI